MRFERGSVFYLILARLHFHNFLNDTIIVSKSVKIGTSFHGFWINVAAECFPVDFYLFIFIHYCNSLGVNCLWDFPASTFDIPPSGHSVLLPVGIGLIIYCLSNKTS